MIYRQTYQYRPIYVQFECYRYLPEHFSKILKLMDYFLQLFATMVKNCLI